jgi:hypothetical protein
VSRRQSCAVLNPVKTKELYDTELAAVRSFNACSNLCRMTNACCLVAVLKSRTLMPEWQEITQALRRVVLRANEQSPAVLDHQVLSDIAGLSKRE